MEIDTVLRNPIEWGVFPDYLSVEVRYDIMAFPNVQEARNALFLADEVRDLISSQLKEKGFKGPA